MKRAASMKISKGGGRCRIPVDDGSAATWYNKKVDEARLQRIADGKPPYVVACRMPDDMIVEFCEPVTKGRGIYSVDADIYCRGELVREEHGIQSFGSIWTGDPSFFDFIVTKLFPSYWDEILASARAKGVL